jgi:hypothetical protein
MRRAIVTVAVISIALALLAVTLVDVVPRRAITPTAIEETSVRIGLYFYHHKYLPPDLAVLPVRDNYANRTTDAWDRPLMYSITSGDSFTLSSFGRDGVAGGQGEDADIVRKFRITDGGVESVP